MKILSKLLKVKDKEKETFINDRRRSKRYDIPLKLDYFYPHTNCHGEALAKNISRTGLRFSVNTKIPKGALLDMKIEDPNSDALIASKAKVVWMEEFIAGDDAEGTVYELGVKLLKKRLY